MRMRQIRFSSLLGPCEMLARTFFAQHYQQHGSNYHYTPADSKENHR